MLIKNKNIKFNSFKTKELNSSKLMLSDDIKLNSIKHLNKILIDLINLRLIFKTAHWNIKCKAFFSLHKMFDEIQEMLDAYTDNVAEQITALAGKTKTSLSEIYETRLNKNNIIDIDSTVYIENLVSILVVFIDYCRESMLELDEKDKITSNYLQELILNLHKILYFLESHIQK